MKDEKLVEDGLKMIQKGLGKEDGFQRPPEVRLSPVQENWRIFKTGLRVCFAVFLVYGAIFLWNLYNQKEFLLRQQVEGAQRFTESVLVGLRLPLLQGEMDVVQNQFEAYRQVHGVMEIQLLEHTGIVKRSTDRSSIGQHAQGRTIDAALDGQRSLVLEADKTRNKKYMEVTVPLANEKTCASCHGTKIKYLGVLRVVLDAGQLTGQ